MSIREKIKLAERSTDPEILAELSKTLRADVKEAVAGNPNCYYHVLEKLSTDSNLEVREAVAKNLSTSLFTLLRLFNEFKRQVSRHPNYINCDLDELREIAYLPFANKQTKLGIVSHPKCPSDILEDFSDHENSSVRAAIASNPNCPDPALINLGDDPNKAIREAAIGNPRSFDIPQIAEKLKAVNKKIINEYTKTKIPKNLNAPSHLHKSINTDLELLLALHKYLTKEN